MNKRVFLLIDDYEPTNILHKQFINSVWPEAIVHCHADPQMALSSLNKANQEEAFYIEPDIIFLDTNMPSMSGWEFLDEYNKLEIKQKEKINIYMLSTFDDDRYRRKVEKTELVKNYFSKPLTKLILQEAIYNKIAEG